MAGFVSCPLEFLNQTENSAEYTVKYYFEKTDGSGYEQDSKYPDIKLSGTIGEKTEASAKTVKGFTADTISQKEIQADGSTVVEIKYKRNQYTLTFSDVYNHTANIPSPVKYRYGETVTEFPELTADGYVFQGWNYGKETYSSSNGKAYVMENSNVTFKAVWAEGEASYTVKHLFYNVNTNSYEADSNYPDEQKTGVTGSYTEAAAKDVPGFSAYVNQETIKGDGSTVAEMRYNSNYYTVTYADGFVSDQIYRYGQIVTVESAISKEGDEFLGWSDGTSLYVPSSNENAFVMPNHDVTLTAQWKYGSKYTVKHYFEELDGTFSDWVSSNNREVISGKAGVLTNAVPRNEPGFTAAPVVQQTIAADGSIVVEIKYYRNVHTVTFDYGYESSVPSTKEYRYGASIEFFEPERTGYYFDYWKYGSEVYDSYFSISFYMPDEDITFTAQWRPDTWTKYTVRYLFQKLNGDGYESSESYADQILHGETDSYTNAASSYRHRTGFTAQSIEEKKIAADGSTVIEIKYDRNVHTVTYADGVDDEIISVPAAKEYRYGATVTVAANISRTGYSFAGWSDGSTVYTSMGTNNSFTMPSHNVTLTAQWTAANVNYKVRHLFQKLSGNDYETNANYPEETEPGTTGSTTNAVAKNVTGFTSLSFSQKKIAADGSTVVEIKYDRNIHTVTYADGVAEENISVPDSQDYRYGAAVNVAANISRTGYSFAGWSDGSSVYTSMGNPNSFTMPDSNITLTAQWSPANVNYKVRHVFQKVSGNEYESNDDYPEETKTGTTTTLTNALSKSVTGFTALSFSQKTIAGNGSTVVEIKYNRNVHTVTYLDGVDEEVISVLASQDYRYGATVYLKTPKRTGYKFWGWNDGISTYRLLETPYIVMNDSDITLKALWIQSETIQNIVMKDGSAIGLILRDYLGAKSSAKYFKPSQNPPAECFTTYKFSQNSSSISVVAWLDGDVIYYYAEGITDTPGKLIPLTDCQMFSSCSSLISIDLSGFDTSKVTYMKSMFNNCESLTSLDVSSFDISNVTDVSYMFYYDTKLKGGNGTSYDLSYKDKTRACVDGLNGKPGYFTAKSE